MEFKPKICQICGTEYIPHNSNQKFCGPACSKQGEIARRRKYDAEAKLRNMTRTIDEKIDRKIENGLARRERHAKQKLSLDEVAKRASLAHMTYGKYVLKHNI